MVATIAGLVAAGLYLKAFWPKGTDEGATGQVIALVWAVAIFGIVSAVFGGDAGPLAAFAAWSKGTL